MINQSLENYKSDTLYPKVVKAVGTLLQSNDKIDTVDILLQMGNLNPMDYELWRKGKVAYLERVFLGSLSKAERMLRIINFHMHDLNMVKSNTTFKELNGKRTLQFSKTGAKKLEEIYSRSFKWNRSQEIKRQIIEDFRKN